MQDQYTNEKRPAFDELLSDLIEAATDIWGGGPRKMAVGFTDEQGHLYREIETNGMGEYNLLVHKLKNNGFVSSGRSGKFDDVFHLAQAKTA
ncbi:hypothetical protein [Jeongeupia chitinilytica]|uniref:Uncharacterized protein n=1 Tax=Jeongeupia chitinilytica TaxID=1041641 RepID=A0ABQ3GZC9_9NEIS|nr:hypothetical protein [Jeongeupia chitinilytica]GHD59817.1 hypothetical protein GCM10007350_11640 [Jeongeupia chitinilytica]